MQNMALSKRQRISAYALICKDGKILLCRISKELPRWQGSWTLPGGGLNFGESPEEAVIREVEEETGLCIETRGIAEINSLRETSETEDFHGIRIIYFADVVGGNIRDEVSGSTDHCSWHELDFSPDINLVGLAELGVKIAKNTYL